MRRFYCIIIFFLLSATSLVYGQDSTGDPNNGFYPYIGANVHHSGVVQQVGLGLEVGIEYLTFYLGGEYGIYGYTIFDQRNTAFPITYRPGDQPPDYIVNREQYY